MDSIVEQILFITVFSSIRKYAGDIIATPFMDVIYCQCV